MSTCYLVGTPIGNLKDITFRAVETLKAADIIFAEDTRHARILLDAYGISKTLKSYHRHKEREGAAEVIDCLSRGLTVCVVTDAGMPAISDPGAILVREIREKGFSVTACPSATAVTTAAALSGMSEKGFAFFGFLPPKNKEKNALVGQFLALSVPVILYSAPHDILTDLNFLHEKLGARDVFVIKEMTKMFETAYIGKLGTVEIADTRGEFVIVIAPAKAKNTFENLTIREHFEQFLAKGMDKKEAIKQVAAERGVHKSAVYKEVLES